MFDSPIKRRSFLFGGTAAAGGFLLSRVALGAAGVAAGGGAGAGGNTRFVFIILRGALDGLSAVPPYGDPDYVRLRGELALAPPGTNGGCLQLDNTFGLHPSLRFLHEQYGARQLAVFHAIATPYRERSHFDGQDVLENGLMQPHAAQTGWLNRALANLPPAQAAASSKETGIALGQNVPLMMRGPAQVASWSPARLPSLDEDTLQRIADRYASDAVLSHRLADALAADAVASVSNTVGGSASNETSTAMTAGGAAAGRYANRYGEVVHAAAGFLRAPAGPKVAVFDTIGWDTHANEGSSAGQLALRLGALDNALRTLRDELGPVWDNTVIMLATEFGRTAATNGTRGTDHGTGSAAFLLGGAVNGGRVIADWPGLSQSALYQARDLAPTLDMRAVMKGVLADQLGVSSRALETDVFPDSKSARPMQSLIRSV